MATFLIVCGVILALIVYFVFGFWTMLIESNHNSEFKTLHRLIIENKMDRMIKNTPWQYHKDINGHYWKINQGEFGKTFAWQSMHNDVNIAIFINTIDIITLIFWFPFLCVDSVRYIKFELEKDTL